MISKKDTLRLSKLTKIDFEVSRMSEKYNRSVDSIFDTKNRSFICFNKETKKYELLLCYEKVSFSCVSNSISNEDIIKALEKCTQWDFERAKEISEKRLDICKELRKGL